MDDSVVEVRVEFEQLRAHGRRNSFSFARSSVAIFDDTIQGVFPPMFRVQRKSSAVPSLVSATKVFTTDRLRRGLFFCRPFLGRKGAAGAREGLENRTRSRTHHIFRERGAATMSRELSTNMDPRGASGMDVSKNYGRSKSRRRTSTDDATAVITVSDLRRETFFLTQPIKVSTSRPIECSERDRTKQWTSPRIVGKTSCSFHVHYGRTTVHN